MRPFLRLAVAAAALLVGPRPPAVADVLGLTGLHEKNNLPRGVAEVDQAVRQFDKGDYDGCYALLERASKAREDLDPPRLMLAKLFFLADQSSAGKAALERAAVETPDHPDVALTLARLALREGRLADAAPHLDRAEARLDASKVPDASKANLRIDLKAARATLAERRRDWASAESALKAWVTLAPTSAEAHQRLGVAFFHESRRDEALAELSRAAGLDASYGPAATALAMLYEQDGDDAKAGEWMAKGVSSSASSVKAHLAFGSWLLDQGRIAEAREQSDQALKLSPNAPEARMLAGLVALRSQDFASAEKTFQALHVEMPANVAVSNRWAIALAEQDDPQKKSRAWQICEVNQKLDPGSAEVLSTRGQVARRLGRGDDAERALRAAASTGQATSDMFYDLAVVLSERGKLGEVKPLLQAALKTPSGFSRRREALAWLARLDPPAKPASVKSVR